MSQSALCQDVHLRSVSNQKKADTRSDERKEVLFNLKEEALLLYNIIHHVIAGFESSLHMIARIWQVIKDLIAEIDDLIFSNADRFDSGRWPKNQKAYPTLSKLHDKLERVKCKLFQELPSAYEVIFPKIPE